MRIEVVNPTDIVQNEDIHISHIVHPEQARDVQLQACTLGNGRLVGLAAYQSILGGEAIRLVGMRLNNSHHMAGLGSVMMRAFAAEQAENEIVMVGVQHRIDLSKMFERACDGRVYPNYTSMGLRRDYDALQNIAERTRDVLPSFAASSANQIYAGRLVPKGFSVTFTADGI